MSDSWTPWHEVVEVRDDVKTKKLTLDTFAAGLEDVIMQRGHRKVYEDPTEFFKLTYPTRNLRDLAREVADRLAGEGTKALRQLEKTYGGGKTHALITLYHLFGAPERLPDEIPAVQEFKSHIGRDLPSTRVSAVPFDYLDVVNGMTVRSPSGEQRDLLYPWSAIAYQLAGDQGLRILNNGQTEERNDPPAAGTLAKVFQRVLEDGKSVLVLLDEVLMYVHAVVGAGKLTREQIKNFFQNLSEDISSVDRCCMIASILASDLNVQDTFGKQLEKEITTILGRKKDPSVRPVEQKDIAEILRRRFFTLESIRDKESFRPHVSAALRGIENLDQEIKKEGQEAEDRYLRNYPFHPSITKVFYEKWTNLESFQEARGVLRIMALAIRDSLEWDDSPLISTNAFLSPPDQVDLDDAASELATIASQEEYEGTKQNWTGILEGELNRSRGIQERFAALSGREVEQAMFAIFLHSQPKGHTANLQDVKHLLGHTHPDKIELDQALKDLTSTSWFLDEKHFLEDRNKVPREWRLGSRPNLTQMHDKAKSRVEDLVETSLIDAIRKTKSLKRGASGAGAVVHMLPQKPGDIKDDGQFHYAVLGPDAASYPGDPNEWAKRFLFETTSKDRPRVNKNAVVLAVPAVDALQTARSQVRNHLAWKEVRSMLKDEDTDDARDQRLRQNIQASKDKIGDAVRQAYSLAVTVGRNGKAEAFKVPAGESSLFAQIKSHDKARIKDSAITPETILPGGPYDLWREGEESRRVSHITEAFAQQPELPKMLRPEGIYDTIALGCEEGTFVLQLPRPDGTVRTEWRTRPGDEVLRESSLEAVLPEHAELANVDPVLLTPGELPKLWKDEEPLSVSRLYDYFSGDTVIEVEKNGYAEPVAIPEAKDEALHDALQTAVKQGLLWLRKDQTSLYEEDVPEGIIDGDAVLKRPPEDVRPTDLLPANLPDAWEDDRTTAGTLLTALSEEYGEPLPWRTVRRAIDGAFRASYMKPTVDSGEWPTDRSGADKIHIQLPADDSAPPSSGDGEPAPPGDYGSGVKHTAGDLEVDEIQNLADEIGELVSAAAGYGIRFHVRVDAGTEESLPDDVSARLNEILKQVSDKLQL